MISIMTGNFKKQVCLPSKLHQTIAKYFLKCTRVKTGHLNY